MALKWFVQSGTEVFGPWSSSRIRDELRAGGIDPFDLAYLEGSSVKRSLIEIDDLFESSAIQPAAITREEPKGNIATVDGEETKDNEIYRPFSPSKFEVRPEDFLGANFNSDQNTSEIPLSGVVNQSSRSTPENQQQGRQKFAETNLAGASQGQKVADIYKFGNMGAPVSEVTPRPESRIETAERPRAFEALASPDRVIRPKTSNVVRVASSKESKQAAPGAVKRYYVLVPGMKMQGPFNSKDLLTLWYAKKLPPNTFIQRTGGQKRVEIQRFVQFYERAQPSGVAFIGEAKLASTSDHSLLWLFLAVFAAVGIIVGALIWKGVRSAKDETILFGSGPLNNIRNNTPVTSHIPPIQQNTGVVPKSSLPSNSLTSSKAATKSGQNSKAKTPKATVSLKVNESAAQRYKYNNAKPYTSKSNSSVNSIRPMNAMKPTSIVPRSTLMRNKPSVTSVGVGFIDGAIVSLSGYRFNPGILASCEAKCKIPMTGPRGPVTVVFFKEAFGSSFTGKSVNASFTGTVRKDTASGAVSILVKSVP